MPNIGRSLSSNLKGNLMFLKCYNSIILIFHYSKIIKILCIIIIIIIKKKFSIDLIAILDLFLNANNFFLK